MSASLHMLTILHLKSRLRIITITPVLWYGDGEQSPSSVVRRSFLAWKSSLRHTEVPPDREFVLGPSILFYLLTLTIGISLASPCSTQLAGES